MQLLPQTEVGEQLRLLQPSLADAYSALVARSRRRDLRPDSLTQYEMLWRRVRLQFPAERTLKSVLAPEVQHWLDDLLGRAARNTVRCCRQFLSMLFSVSIQVELFDGTNPVKRTDPIRPDRPKVKRRLNEAEIADLIRACQADSSPRGRMWTTFFQVMLLTGLRVRETSLLRWEDFQWSAGVFKPSHQKRSAGGDVLLITPEIETVLAIWGNRQPQVGLIFPEVARYDARRFCDRARRALKHFAHQAGLPDPRGLGTQALRRTFITRAAEASHGDHLTLMQVARHRDLETTRLYMPTVSKAVREVSTSVAHSLAPLLGITAASNRLESSHPPRSRSESVHQLRLPFE